MRASSFNVASALRRIYATKPSGAPLLLAILFLAPAMAMRGTPAQTKPPQPQSSDKEGLFLVARRGMSDPLFAKSAVLMLPIKDESLIVGLIINKPTHVSLAELFPNVRALQKDDRAAYFGGPVDIYSRSAIFRSPTPPKKAIHIFADVYVAFDSDAVRELIKNFPPPSALRVFLGRAQWSQGQLQREMLQGAWYSVRLNADPIFSDQPEQVWQTLLDRLEPKPYVDFHLPSKPLNRRATAPLRTVRSGHPVRLFYGEQPINLI
jgi:putative transcriptional regulator